MGSEDRKTARELAALTRFLDASGLRIKRQTIRKLRGDRQPDFGCEDADGNELAFELTEICTEELAKLLARPITEVVRTGDPTERIVREKMHKRYDTTVPIDLVCYWGARTVSTDDIILPTIQRVVDSVSDHPFRRIYYHGEERHWPVHDVS